MNNLKFATKILLVILGVSIISMIAVSTISYTELLNLSGYSQSINVQLGFFASDESKDALIDQAESYMSRLAVSQASECNSVLQEIQNDVIVMAGFMEELYKNPANFQGRRLPLPNETQQGIPSAKMMTAGNAVMNQALQREMLLVSNAEYLFTKIFEANSTLSNAYLGTGTGISFRYSRSNAHNPDYDPRTRPWYINAYNSDGPVWLDAYLDPFGFILTTCAKAYKDANGNTAGVVASDILLSTMVNDILNFRIGETGYAFLLDDKGRYLAHPHYSDIDPDALGTTQGEYKEVIARMASGKINVEKTSINAVDHYIAYAPLPITGWSLGIAVEYDEIVSGALMMKSSIDNQALETKDQIRSMLNSVMLRFIVLTCIIIIAVLILSILVSGSVTKPMIKLANSVIEVGKGNLDSKIDINTKDEIGVLACCFNKMTDDLKDYIANLSKITAEKERIGAELSIATEIQADMLPKIFPPFSNRDDIHIAPIMQPAKEVGGDFYDFFFLDDEHSKLALVIADVSGKGVPAALFMVIAKVIIKNNKDMPVDQVLEAANNVLCADNNSSMFVTAFYSVLDLKTGEYTYASAGHNPPILYRVDDNTAAYLTLPKTPPLALFPNKKLPAQTALLKKGDMVLLYTDGITEAFNTESKMYGTERLLQNLIKLSGSDVEDIVVELHNTVKDFAGSEPQSDDITMVCFRFFGRGDC